MGSLELTRLDYDAIIIGAGFGGLRTLYELRKRGLNAKCFEAGSGVGGAWYWNRYPAARTDSESWVYIFTFLEDIGMPWTWKERFPTQPEVEAYLNRVTDHLGLREHIQLNTRIASAQYSQANNSWKVTTAEGGSHVSTFLVGACGPLSRPLPPPYPGLEIYKGEWYQTGLWPQDKQVDFVGKRVAVIGTGATGIQVVPSIAHNAGHVVVFQRTPNYVLPARNHPLEEAQAQAIERDYPHVWERARSQPFGSDIPVITRIGTDVDDPAEIQAIFEYGWEKGGFRFVFETFADMMTNQAINDAGSEFIRRKIRALVKDPKTAELLCPRYSFLSKRPPLGHHYYETFNRENVQLHDINEDPILEMTPLGIRTQHRDFEFDMVIFAVGFDAVTGPLSAIDIRGLDGQGLRDRLNTNLETAYGIAVAGFPNFFIVTGPQVPFANLPVIIDNTADFIGRTVTHMRENGLETIDADKDTAKDWSNHVDLVFKSTILTQSAKDTRSWLVGANMEGKVVRPQFYFGGVGPYLAACEKELASGFPGFNFTPSTKVS